MVALESNKIDNQIWRFKNPSNQLKPDGKVAMVPDELRQYSEPLTSHMDIPATDFWPQHSTSAEALVQ